MYLSDELEIAVPNEDGTIELPDELFEAEGSEEEVEETTEETEVEESVTDDTTETEEENDEEEDFADKESLLKALNKERKLRKEAEKKAKIKKQEEKIKSAYDELIESGVDENIAKTISKIAQEPMQKLQNMEFENALLKLSKKTGFEDVEDYAEDIKSFVDKGLTIEQAYYALTGGKKSKTTKAEIQRQVESKLMNKAKRDNALNIDTSGSTKADVKEEVKYSAEEIAIARASGMSIEEYIAYRDINSVNDDYEYRKKRK